jgi:hypothetical protein
MVGLARIEADIARLRAEMIEDYFTKLGCKLATKSVLTDTPPETYSH